MPNVPKYGPGRTMSLIVTDVDGVFGVGDFTSQLPLDSHPVGVVCSPVVSGSL
jgi:hypothetical protein